MRKIIMTAAGLAVIGACSVALLAQNAVPSDTEDRSVVSQVVEKLSPYRTLSESEIRSATAVTEQEKEQLKEAGTDYESIVEKSTQEINDLFETYFSDDKDDRFIFEAAGGMSIGRSMVIDEGLGKILAMFDAEKDPNSFSYDEAKEIQILKSIRYNTDVALGKK